MQSFVNKIIDWFRGKEQIQLEKSFKEVDVLLKQLFEEEERERHRTDDD